MIKKLALKAINHAGYDIKHLDISFDKLYFCFIKTVPFDIILDNFVEIYYPYF